MNIGRLIANSLIVLLLCIPPAVMWYNSHPTLEESITSYVSESSQPEFKYKKLLFSKVVSNSAYSFYLTQGNNVALAKSSKSIFGWVTNGLSTGSGKEILNDKAPAANTISRSDTFVYGLSFQPVRIEVDGSFAEMVPLSDYLAGEDYTEGITLWYYVGAEGDAFEVDIQELRS